MVSGSAHTHQSALASRSASAGGEVLEMRRVTPVSFCRMSIDFRAIANATRELPREGLADPAHAADRLEHGASESHR